MREARRRMMLEERRQLRQFLATLGPEQWSAPSLCEGWTVRDVVAHLVAWDDLIIYRTRDEHLKAMLRFAGLYLRSFASMAALNRRLMATGTVDELLDRFAADDDPELKWLFDGSNPGAHLAEYVIHDHDIRQPLGSSRRIPSDHLVAALDGVGQLPGVRLGAWRRKARHRWVATDVDWSGGRGDPKQAPGLDILLTLAGRGQAA